MIVPDNDICKNTNFDDFGISKIFGEDLNYLLNDMHHTLLAHKDTLPDRAKKFKYPTIMWIAPPGHKVFTDNAR